MLTVIKKSINTMYCSERDVRYSCIIGYDDINDKIVLYPCWFHMLSKSTYKDVKYDPEYFLNNFFNIIEKFYNIDYNEIFYNEYCKNCPRFKTIKSTFEDYNHNNYRVLIMDIVKKCNGKC